MRTCSTVSGRLTFEHAVLFAEIEFLVGDVMVGSGRVEVFVARAHFLADYLLTAIDELLAVEPVLVN